MRVLIFGATGLVGQGILRECFLDTGVEEVVAVGRSALQQSHPKLRELILPDLFEEEGLWEELRQFDAAFFCIGVSAVGMPEASYRRITHDLTLSIASPLARANPGMTFIYVSAAGASLRSRMMWARIKAETESALAALPFKAVYLFRPGYIQPQLGSVSRTAWYGMIHLFAGRLAPVLDRYFPWLVTSADRIGRAALEIARRGFPRKVLENREINEAALRFRD